MANLDSSIAYFTMMSNAVIDLEAKDPPTFTSARNQTSRILDGLLENRATLSDYNDSLKKVITATMIEANWLSGNSTVSADLQTVSKRHFTIDLGLTNLNLADNSGKRVNVQKLFLGVNIFAHALDKNVNFKYIKNVDDEDDGHTHRLESRNDFFHK